MLVGENQVIYLEEMKGGDDNTWYRTAIPKTVKLTRRGNSQLVALHLLSKYLIHYHHHGRQ